MTPATSLLSSVADDMYEHLRALFPDPCHLEVLEDAEAPCLWAVWLDGDILGAGESRSEALADAVETVRGWE